MGYKVVEFQDTPNPNALKCVLDRGISDGVVGMRSYQSEQAAGGDSLGRALLGVPGVSGVLIQGEWVTVNKRAEAEWRGVKAGVKRVLGEAG